VARTFKVSVASVVKWSQRHRATGSAAAKPMGRRQARSLAPQRGWLLARLEASADLTLRALVAELGERGVVTSYGSVWRIVHDAGLSFKKNAVRHRARPA
jgi:transposase